MAVEMVTCSNGHRFLVNKNKHLNRDYRICPRKGCYAKVRIRGKKWSFDPSSWWPKFKEESQEARLSEKAKAGKRHPPLAPLPMPTRAQILAQILHFRQKKVEETEG